MKVASDGTRTCVAASTGCGAGFFANEQMICKPCDSTCATCISGGPDGCLTCTDSAKVVLSTKIHIDKNNQESDFEKQTGSTTVAPKFEVDPNQKFGGKCEANCNGVEGIAMYAKSGVCTVCEPFGCTACDSSGVCTACDKKKGLSLVTDAATSKKVCSKCTLLDKGCLLCQDTDNTKCKMCKFPEYSLDTTTNTCVKKCSSGFFAKEMTLAASDAPPTKTMLKYNQ